MNKNLKVVILCGGSGTRLWPISTTSEPKQFLQLFNEKSLFQLTIERNLNLTKEFIIILNEAQLAICEEQIKSYEITQNCKFDFIIEPMGKNTAPAITFAAYQNQNALLLVLPSDHFNNKIDEYEKNIKEAIKINESKNHVIFGIRPHYPETGYGYIEADQGKVISFKEKPNLETAQKYIDAKTFYWNSGMFLFDSDLFLKEINEYRPQIFESSVETLKQSKKVENKLFLDKDQMGQIQGDSIDYALMENSKVNKMVEVTFSWNDLGSFESLSGVFPPVDNHNNYSNQELYSVNARDNFVLSKTKKKIALIEVNDLCIIETENEILICPKKQSQKVKDIYNLVHKKK